MEVEIFRKKVKEAISKYNKYRAPEAEAKLISLNNKIKVEFTGPFCRTCGFYDYFEDLIIFLEESGIKSEIVEIEEFEEGAIVSFKIEPNI